MHWLFAAPRKPLPQAMEPVLLDRSREGQVLMVSGFSNRAAPFPKKTERPGTAIGFRAVSHGLLAYWNHHSEPSGDMVVP